MKVGSKASVSYTCKIRALQILIALLFCASVQAQPSTVTVGAIAGNFEVSSLGSANYTIPISLPPGTGTLLPNLALSYDSAQPNGLLGVGWSVSGVSVISRCPSTKVQDGFIDSVDFDNNDKLCIDGQRLMVDNGGSYGADGTSYRTENDIFSRVFSYGQLGSGPAYLVAKTKTGFTFEYGTNSDSQLEAQGRIDILTWKVSKIKDQLGNTITFSYLKESQNGISYLDQIQYTANLSQGLLANNFVNFHYELRPDKITHFISGSKVHLDKRLKLVEVSQNQQSLMTYTLSYQQGLESKRSQLIAVSQCDSSANCLQPTTFTYKQGLSGFDTPQRWLSAPIHLFTYGNNHEEFADFNGDGLADRIWMPNWHTSFWVSLSTGSGFTQPQQWQGNNAAAGLFPTYSDYGRHEAYADLNGDGKSDRIWMPFGQNTFWAALSTGSGFTQAQQWLPPVTSGPANFSDIGRHEAYTDLNGDGKADRIWMPSTQGSFWAAISNGTGFAAPQQWLAVNSAGNGSYPSFSDYGRHEAYVDLNGDGMSDRVWMPSTQGSFWVALSNASGFTTPTQWLAANSAGPGYPSFSDYGRHEAYVDLNGDGLPDRVWMPSGQGSIWVALSRGNGFDTPQQWLGSNAAGNGAYPSFSDYGRHESYADLNADGMMDRVWIPNGQDSLWAALSTGSSFSAPYQILSANSANGSPNFSANGASESFSDVNGDGLQDRVWIPNGLTNDMWVALKKGPAPDYLTTITTGTSAETKIEYATLNDSSVYTRYNNAVYPVIDIKAPIYVVSAYATSNGLNDYSWYSYHYSGLKAQLDGRGFSGYALIKRTDQQTGNYTETSYWQDFPYKGISSGQKVYLADATLVRETLNTRALKSLFNNTVYFPYIKESTETQYEIDGSFVKATITKNYYDDQFGNLIKQEIFFSDGSSQVLDQSFQNQTSNWLIGLLTSSAVTKAGPALQNSPALTRTTTYSYDPSNALLLEEIVEPLDPALRLEKSYDYDGYGNVTRVTTTGNGVPARIELKSYDSRGQFPVQLVNALGHVEQASYDYRNGKMASLSDSNQATTTWQYDSFGRIIRELRPDGTETLSSYELPQNGAPANSKFVVRTVSSGSAPILIYSDELGREIRRESVGLNGQKIFVDKVYDQREQLASVSDPYFQGSIPLWNVNQYDLLGRMISQIAPGNRVTTTTYLGLTTRVTNPLGQDKTQTVDCQGRVLTAIDDASSAIQYKYDSFGNLIELIDPNGKTTSMEYDLRGNKIKLNDPSLGINTYQYDSFGQLIQETNANNQSILYNYDNLGRIITRTRQEGSESWQYDIAQNGIGKLAKLTGLNGYQESYSYDSLGRLVATKTKIANNRYTTKQSYDSFGRISRLIYPSRFSILYRYSPEGILSEILNGENSSSIWRVSSQNARGQTEQQVLGNLLVNNRVYDPNTGFLTGIQTSAPQLGSIQNLTFASDQIGNLLSRADLNIGASETFSYDNLNRLISATVAGQGSINMSYDNIGNILSRSDVGSYHYSNVNAGPYALTSITGARANSYSYDSAGNRIFSSHSSIAYSSTSKPIRIISASKLLEYDLDPKDRRIEQRSFLSTQLLERKVYVSPIFERIEKNGSEASFNHYINGVDGPIAVFITPETNGAAASWSTNRKSKWRYILTDHLGSIHTVTDQFARVVERLSFNAWGERRDPNTWGPATTNITSKMERGFTAHEQLDEVGLIHMNGRVYDPISARFVSPDPIVQTPTNAQSLNRYSYVLNNPLSYTDPTGYFSFKKMWNKAKGIIKPVAIAAAVIVATIYVPPLVTSYLASTTLFANMLCTTAYGAYATTALSAIGTAAGGFTGAFIGGVLNGDGIGGGLSAGVRGIPRAIVGSWLQSGAEEAIGWLGLQQPSISQNSLTERSNVDSTTAKLFSKAESAVNSQQRVLPAATKYLKNKNGLGEALSENESMLSALGHLSSKAFSKTATLPGSGWKVPAAAGLVSRFSAVGNMIGAAYQLGENPTALAPKGDLVMGVLGFIPGSTPLTLGYDLGKLAAHGADKVGFFDWWVNNVPR